ncbi:MAG: TonB-dependent receptor [Bacteroidota bacterium]
MKCISSLLLLFLPVFSLSAQGIIRGTVYDLQTLSPLPSAQVILLSSDPPKGTLSKENGEFRLEGLSLGRHSVQVRYLGYETVTRANLIVTAGKEVVLQLGMEEKITTADEVEILAEVDKMEAQNELSSVSARTISMEEALRYAGSRNDPARMAQNFAGVSGANDQRNDIIIRGNSPTGVLWRLEGIDVPNPNHFGALGTTGGPVSMLNNNNLDNSDFLTGAFPAEYGNALAGVFDLKLRSGNNEQHEFMGQIGFNGFELGAEGPLSKNSRASYIANYRYSTLGVFNALGISFGTGTAVPQYQDLVFKLDVPTDKTGRWKLFGMGGVSNISFIDSEQDGTGLFNGGGQDLYNDAGSGVIGLSNTHLFSESSYGTISLAATAIQSGTVIDTLDINGIPGHFFASDFSQIKYGTAYQYNHKFNAKNQFRAGAMFDFYVIHLLDSVYDVGLKGYRISRDDTDQTSLGQAYAQWKHRFTDQVSLNLGLHAQYLSLNGSLALEPRMGFSYQLSERHRLSLGIGQHSQMQPIQVYFLRTLLPDGSFLQTNKELDFVKSTQLVLGYDVSIGQQWRIKVESYYQNLTQVAVQSRASSFSMLNAGADFSLPNVDSLVNEGRGSNIGFEFTLEKFFSDGYYALLTASVFDSKYTGSDQQTYNTIFNGNYILNLLGGKEWKLGKRNTLSVDAKVTYAGGKRFTPIDLAASRMRGETIFESGQIFEDQYDPYFRSDLKLTFRLNGKRTTQDWSVDLQNISNHQNIFTQSYNPKSSELETTYQIGLFPVFQYRVLF